MPDRSFGLRDYSGNVPDRSFDFRDHSGNVPDRSGTVYEKDFTSI